MGQAVMRCDINIPGYIHPHGTNGTCDRSIFLAPSPELDIESYLVSIFHRTGCDRSGVTGITQTTPLAPQ